MLSEYILTKISNGEITSRRQIYQYTRKSKELIQYLNDNDILVPKRYTKEMFDQRLKELEKSGKSTLSKDNVALVSLSKRFYGTWDKALESVLHKTNQHVYNELSDAQMLATIRNYCIKYKRLPLRSEFDGSSYERPHYESFITRFKLKRFSDIYKFVDLNDVVYYHDTRHGTGKVYLYNDIVYLSHQEYLIGKYLTDHNIKFEKEVPYGNCKYIFDFYLCDFDVYIEYHSMATKAYKDNILKKKKKYNGRRVIEIFKHDNTIKKLDEEVQRL